MRVIISAEGYAIRQAADAAEAITAIDEAPPSLVILDINVPGDEGGMSVLHHIRIASAGGSTPVPMVTGISAARDHDWGRTIGADAHLLKPFQIDELRTVVCVLFTRT